MQDQTKLIGLIGGMSWESTKVYYEHLNIMARERLGGAHSARIIISSVDFAETEALTSEGNWQVVGDIMAHHAKKLQNAGAEMILLCTNTIHLVSRAIEEAVSIPFIHIADATGRAVTAQGVRKAGLLGTRFTMEREFYSSILKSRYDLEVLTPPEADRQRIHDNIYNELVRGVFTKSSAQYCSKLIKDLRENGAQGVILGCTELPLLMNNYKFDIPLFDTTRIHAGLAIDLSLKADEFKAV